MMAGPQEMTAIIFVTYPNPVKVSLAFLAGVTAAMVPGTTIYCLLAGTIDLGDPSSTGSSGTIPERPVATPARVQALVEARRKRWLTLVLLAVSGSLRDGCAMDAPRWGSPQAPQGWAAARPRALRRTWLRRPSHRRWG